MRILLLADIASDYYWGSQAAERLKDIDLIISCGDLPAEYLSFLTCFTKAPILYVCGNHDDRYVEHPPEGCECIDGKLYKFNGLRILGLGGSKRYKPGINQYTESEMRRRIKKLRFKIINARGVDILVTHAPAKGLGDGDDHVHEGFSSFLYFLNKYKPKYHFFGHMHKSYSYKFERVIKYNDSTLVNGYERYIIEI